MRSRPRRLTALLCMLVAALGGVLPSVAVATGLVAVAGADGPTGRLVVRELLAAGYAVRALVRDPAAGGFAGGVEVVQVEVREPASLGPALAGATALVIATGAGDANGTPEQVHYRGVQNLAGAAAAAKLGQVVLLSSAGVTRDDHPLNRYFDNVLQWQARGEDALRTAGVPYTIVRPGGLIEADAGAGGIRLDQGDAGTGFIPRADVARIAVAALGAEAARGRTFEAYAAGGPPPADWAKTFNALAADVAGSPGESKP